MAETIDPTIKSLLIDLFKDTLDNQHNTVESLDIQQIRLAKDILLRMNHQLLMQEQRLQTTSHKDQPAFSFAHTATASLKQTTDGLEALNQREKEILLLIAEGLSNKDISNSLNLKLSTIKWYSTSIFEKLSVENRTQAAKKARQLDLLP